MRLVIAGVALLLVTTTAAAAQSRWTLSAGPEWTSNLGGFVGGRVRAEYDLLRPTKPLRLRLDLGAYWEPSQSFSGTYLDGSTVAGWKQSMDITFGLSTALSPFPRARFAPYLTVGALARQSWRHSSSFYFPAGTVSSTSGTSGDIVFPLGLGLRARIARHLFQVEVRRFQGLHTNSLTVGTNLPF